MAKLATLRVIRDIEPIPEADLIVKAWVDGWSLVTQKTNFKVGDVALYMEVDTCIPVDHPAFAFLADRGVRTIEGVKYHKLKTIRLKKTLSQGLLIPLEALEALGHTFRYDDFDKDYGEELGMIRWDPEIHQGGARLAGNALRSFPSNTIPKTDLERIQNNMSILQDDSTYEASMKLEGSSLTVYYNANDQYDYGVCSKNLQLKLDDPVNTENAFVKTAAKYELESKLRAYGKNIAIQFELMGPGIQNNIEGFADYKLFAYRVWDIDAQRMLLPKDRRALIAQLGLDHVPVLDDNVKINAFTLDTILAYADGPSIHAKLREGVVFKSNTYDKWGGVTAVKVISNKYLLKSTD